MEDVHRPRQPRAREREPERRRAGESRGGAVRWQMVSPGPGDDDLGSEKLTHGVCVLGMHRSGTSLVAGVLRQLGVDLGPDEEFLPPDPNNQSGYFELADAVEINNEILAHYGGGRDDPPGAPPRSGQAE